MEYAQANVPNQRIRRWISGTEKETINNVDFSTQSQSARLEEKLFRLCDRFVKIDVMIFKINILH